MVMQTDKEGAEALRKQFADLEQTAAQLLERTDQMQRMLSNHRARREALTGAQVCDLINALSIQVKTLACGVGMCAQAMAAGFADWVAITIKGAP